MHLHEMSVIRQQVVSYHYRKRLEYPATFRTNDLQHILALLIHETNIRTNA